MRKRAVGASRSGAAAAIAGGVCVAAAIVAVLLATAAGGSGGGYTVRAIFDDAGNLVNSENVKIDGVKVGTVGTVTPTPNGKAAVTLNIENPGFQNFRTDATCTIEPQALIGEKYVNCLPTQARAEGAPLPPPLHQIPAGREGAGQYLLPVTNTSSPVGVDLLSDIGHLPENQRLTIILNELGTGLAGRGSDLNAVLHRSNPALRELEKVFGILASENKVLGNLAEEGNRALVPLVRERKQFSEFFAQSNTVAEATARHGAELATNLHEFPTFLRELRPYLKHLEAFAEQSIPTFTDLGVAAPGINRTFQNIGPFSTSTTQFFKSLGASSGKIGKALVGTQPLLTRIESLGSAAKPFAKSFSELFSSLRCDRRRGAPARLHLHGRGLGQRLRLARPLRPRGRGREDLRRLQNHARPRMPLELHPRASRRAAEQHGAQAASAQGERHDARDGEGGSDAQGRHAVAGDGRVPRLGSGREPRRPRQREPPVRRRPAGRRSERRHHLLHAAERKRRSRRAAAQLPARQLIDDPTTPQPPSSPSSVAPWLACCALAAGPRGMLVLALSAHVAAGRNRPPA